MNLKTIGLITLLLILMAITVKVLANIKAEQIKIKIDETCIEEVEEVAETVEGVIQTTWNEETGELEIMYEEDETSLQEIEKTISEAGFATPNFPVPESTSEKEMKSCKD